jgi:hypothetical protein
VGRAEVLVDVLLVEMELETVRVDEDGSKTPEELQLENNVGQAAVAEPVIVIGIQTVETC